MIRTFHGHTKNGYSPTYQSWESMRSRCHYDNRHNHERYKDRGIIVCERWNVFTNFLEDMGERPAGTTLDRIDYDGNYEHGNCRWATPVEQARNTRHTKLTFDTAVQIAIERLKGERCRIIAQKYNVAESVPKEIIKGRCWKDALAEARKILEVE
jgi:hypothetical protein